MPLHQRVSNKIRSFSRAIENGQAYADDGHTYPSVQQAVDQAENVVWIGPGTFDEPVTISTPGLVVFGSGRTTVIDGGTAGHGLEIAASDVVVQNLAAQTTGGAGNANDALRVASGASGSHVINCWVTDSDDEGFQVEASHVVVADCVAEQTDDEGFYVGGSESWIYGCEARSGVGGTGAYINKFDSWVTDFFAENTGASGVKLAASDGTASNCFIKDAGGNGIEDDGSRSIIIGNQIEGAGSDGIDISASTDTFVWGNQVDGSTGSQYNIGTATRPVVDGIVPNPETLNLGGANGPVSPTHLPIDTIIIYVDAGSANANLQGINNITMPGQKAIVKHTGSNSVVLEHNAAVSNPLLNKSGANDTLGANEELAEYVYDGAAWRQLALNN